MYICKHKNITTLLRVEQKRSVITRKRLYIIKRYDEVEEIPRFGSPRRSAELEHGAVPCLQRSKPGRPLDIISQRKAEHVYRGVRFDTEQQRNPDCRSSTAAIDKTGDVGNTTQESEEE